MVKALGDLCLGCIQQHLDSIPNLSSSLPTLYKERLIERLAYHDLLHKSYLPHICYNLLSPSLRNIKLYMCQQVDDHFLTLLADAKCQLEVLVINGCSNVTDVGVQSITKGQDKLCVLELKKLPKLTSAGLTAVVSPALWKVAIKKCSIMTSCGLSLLAQNCPGIKVLYVTHCIKVDKQAYSIVAAGLGPSLEELGLGGQGVTDEEVIKLSQLCPNLRKLDLAGAKYVGKEALIKLFQGCTKLESLDLSYCSRLAQPEECQALWILPQSLRQVSLCGILVEDEQVFVEGMQRLRSVTSVRLCGVLALNDTTLTQILKHIGPKLESLDISGGFCRNLTDEGLKAVTKYCVRLEDLCLSLLGQIQGLTLIPIFQQPERAARFKKLYLSCKMLEASVLSLVTVMCHELTLLELSGHSLVNDEMLFQLAENCPKLSHLGIKGCRQVTDDSICELARCCPLKSLVLSGIHNLTDKCIFALANSCPQLTEIYLNGCARISPAAVRYLSDCCTIRLFVCHVIPNAVPNQLMAKNLDTGEFCRMDVLSSSLDD